MSGPLRPGDGGCLQDALPRGAELPGVHRRGNSQAGRAAGFNEMLAYLQKNPQVRYLLCEKTDRLSRNFWDIATLDDLMNRQGLVMVLVKENTELHKDSRSHEKFIFGIKALMAMNYIDNLSEEVRKGQGEKAAQGEYPSIAPIGFRNNL